jgi:acetyltransferase-like isoleucine patch superfamily enzyme
MFRVAANLYRHIRRQLELRRYTPYTIAEYFRKQGARIGEGCYIVPTELSTEPYLVRIGNRVAIASGVSLITHDGGAFMFRNEVPDLQTFGPIVIEDNCMVGQHAVIFPGVRIGPNSIVGAGSVVVNDVPPNSIVMGVPARPFGSLEKYREKCLERWRAQRPPDVVIEPGATWWSSRHFPENRAKLRAHLLKLFENELAPASSVRD